MPSGHKIPGRSMTGNLKYAIGREDELVIEHERNCVQ